MFSVKSTLSVCSLSLLIGFSNPLFAEYQVNNANGYGKFEFALIGDVPYGVLPGEDYRPFQNLIDAVNADKKIKWVLHAGDIKSGSTPCSDAMFYDRLNRYNQFDQPFILTPGDNGWTDCHRVAAGEYQPLERLAKLREVFFTEPGYTMGGTIMRVDTQGDMEGFEEFPENVRWMEQNIVFATLHVVGSNNGLSAFDPNSSAVRTQADDEEVARRKEATLEWIDAAFAEAEAIGSPAIFLMFQANPGLERGGSIKDAFVEIMGKIEQHTKNFGKPVMLAHGDSHYFRVDKPGLVESDFLPNFTRVETFGESRVHWLRVEVDPKSPEVFTVHQEIVADNP